jgi:cobalt-precorrin 5A hydrolase
MLLNDLGHEVKAITISAYAKETAQEAIEEPLKEWTKRNFDVTDGIVFIGATGIAVRSIAPLVKDKTTDPAVLVLDEKGEFVIPLLSGHIGGANELAYDIGAHLGSIPVITTATDINQKFAVDLFAKKNNLYITRMDLAKGISAAILNDKRIGFECDFPVIGLLPEELTDIKDCEYGICISLADKTEPYDKIELIEKKESIDEIETIAKKGSIEKTLRLIPRIITLGIGCRKGKSSEEIEKVVLEILKLNQISIHSISNVVSIDLKKEEAGLLEFCNKLKLRLVTYPAELLERVQGSFQESDYVKSVTGIGNVCERAAILGSNNGIMIQRKYAKNGVTVSIARKNWSVKF